MKRVTFFNLTARSGMLHYGEHFCNAFYDEYVDSKKRGDSRIEMRILMPGYAKKTCNYKKEIKKIFVSTDPQLYKFIYQSLNPVNWWILFKALYKADYVHFLDNHPWMLVLMPVARLMNKVVIHTQHDPVLHSGENLTILGRVSNIVNEVARYTSHFIIIHSKVMVSFFKRNHRYKIIVIKHGAYNAFGKMRDGVRKYRQVLFFGRIVDYKGLDILLEAWGDVVNVFHDAKLVIAGDGDLSKYNRLINDNKSSIEVINKYIDNELLIKIFSESAVLILPYKDATQSGPLTIAYQFKMPVIVTNVGGLPEVVINNKTGWLIPPGNNKLLSKAILKALSNKDILKEYGHNAYLFARKELRWSKSVTDAYSKIFQDNII